MLNYYQKGGNEVNDLEKKIKKLRKLVAQLTQLVWDIGSLLAVLKFIIESLR